MKSDKQVCTKCGVEKTLDHFSSNGAGLHKKRCKPCRSKDEAARYLAKTPDERKAVMARIANWVKNNRDKYRAYARTMRRGNDHYRLKVQLRRRRHRMATPLWADKAAIAEIYKHAAKLTRATGTPYEVDHIVPLISSSVCGLHCEANLQVIPMIDNKRKNNFRWPDMP